MTELSIEDIKMKRKRFAMFLHLHDGDSRIIAPSTTSTNGNYRLMSPTDSRSPLMRQDLNLSHGRVECAEEGQGGVRPSPHASAFDLNCRHQQIRWSPTKRDRGALRVSFQHPATRSRDKTDATWSPCCQYYSREFGGTC